MTQHRSRSDAREVPTLGISKAVSIERIHRAQEALLRDFSNANWRANNED